jgi:hypothetical protein
MGVAQFGSVKRDFASHQGSASRACTRRPGHRNDRRPRNGLGCAGTAVQVVAIQAFEAYLRSMPAFDSLQEFVHRHRRLFVLTGGGLQHGLRHPGLSECRRKVEAPAAVDVPGLHGRRGDAPAISGTQFDRVASLRSGYPDKPDRNCQHIGLAEPRKRFHRRSQTPLQGVMGR